MKYLPTLLFILCASFIQAQTEKTTRVDRPKSSTVKIEATYGDVKIQSWDKSHIEIVSSAFIDRGLEDHRHKLEIKNNAGGVEIISLVDIEGLKQRVIGLSDDGDQVVLPGDQWDGPDMEDHNGYKMINVSYDIEVDVQVFMPRNMNVLSKIKYGDLEMDGQFKNVDAKSTYGMIEAKIHEVNNMEALTFCAKYDLLDLTIDKNSRATFRINNRYGEMLTDLPLVSSSKTKKRSCMSLSNAKMILNEGGIPIELSAPYDNIYIRSFESRRDYEMKKL